MNQQEITMHLRESGTRVTPQRVGIAEAVINSTDHPSVQQILERVKDHFPSMTLATIYSTLDGLEKSGLIQELPFPQYSRYESNLAPHVNLVCVRCGNVSDSEVGQQLVSDLKTQISTGSSFKVSWQRVDFHGWCSKCMSENPIDVQPVK